MNTKLLARRMIEQTLIKNTQYARNTLAQLFSDMDDRELVLVFCRTGKWKPTGMIYPWRKIAQTTYGQIPFGRGIRLLDDFKWVEK